MNRPRCYTHTANETLPAGCQTCRRIQLEQRIVRRTAKVLLAAGYVLQVNNGEDITPETPTDSLTGILTGMMETDDEYLIVTGKGYRGWVRFVYGNDGWDVISDYTVSLEDVLKPVFEYADRMGG